MKTYQPLIVAKSNKRVWIRNLFSMVVGISFNRGPSDVTVFIPRFQGEAWFCQLRVLLQFQMHFLSKRVHSVVPRILVIHVTRVPPVERVRHEITVFVGLIWLCYFIFWNWSRKQCWYTIVNEHRQIEDESYQLLYTHTSTHTKSSYFNKNRKQGPS